MIDLDRRPEPTPGSAPAPVQLREIEDLHGRSADAFADAVAAARVAVPALATV